MIGCGQGGGGHGKAVGFARFCLIGCGFAALENEVMVVRIVLQQQMEQTTDILWRGAFLRLLDHASKAV